VQESRVRWSPAIAGILLAVFHVAIVIAIVDALRTRSVLRRAEGVVTTLILSPARIPSRTKKERVGSRSPVLAPPSMRPFVPPPILTVGGPPSTTESTAGRSMGPHLQIP
jgi:hypothetical protein